MSRTEHDGIIADGQTYTHKSVAQILGVSPDWVIQNCIYGDDAEPGVACVKMGRLYIFSGFNFRLWTERVSEIKERPEN